MLHLGWFELTSQIVDPLMGLVFQKVDQAVTPAELVDLGSGVLAHKDSSEKVACCMLDQEKCVSTLKYEDLILSPIGLLSRPMELSGPRWKGKGSSAKAIINPMSKIVASLQSSLLESKACALLSGQAALLQAGPEQADLLKHACFGRPIVTAEKDKEWFQLGLEEAFFLSHSLKCLSISPQNNVSCMNNEAWGYMKSKNKMFPNLYKAYSHLRSKNWVVRPGSQYGADFVVYRHHPALVHSEFAVLVLSEGDGDGNARLKVWSDLQGMLRLCGSVAKTLLVLRIDNGGRDDDKFPICLESHIVEEYTITRWIPEQHREDHSSDKDIAISATVM